MNLNQLVIRPTNKQDFDQIIDIEKRAFGRKSEAELTAGILNDKTAEPIVSLLALHQRKPVGHILFSRGYIENMNTEQLLFHFLAPLAVVPEYQKQEIGGQLIKAGLQHLKDMRSKMVFLLGHIEYYPKFGFITDARIHGYHTIHPIPEKVKDAWMFLSLTGEKYPIEKGKVLCCEEMNKPEHWQE
ncbi:MAG: GNAT family N-acetyltransferase [Fidelibacterota bacterium]